jgi:hypothetical protein
VDAALGALSLPRTAGWEIVHPLAVKVWQTLVDHGPSGATTAADLAERAGVGKRRIGRWLKELAVLGWLSYRTTRHVGLTWELRAPATAELPERAVQFYLADLEEEQARLDARRERLRRAGKKKAEAK